MTNLDLLGDARPLDQIIKDKSAKMKEAATSPVASIRKQAFVEYFERFEEFPSYLFDNERALDALFQETILSIESDPSSSPALLKGVAALKLRLSF